MALPPTIPTSFVPHPGGATPKRYRADFTGAFAFFAYGVLGIVVILALGVFFYGRILASEQAAKDAALQKAESSINPQTVTEFVRLRDRLSASKQLLDAHVAFSQFFTTLEQILPASVQFDDLEVSIGHGGTPTLKGTGTAKNFNALAAASNSFAQNGTIKDAIFSNIKINQDGTVAFAISATLDPKVIAYAPTALASASTTPTAGSTGSTVASSSSATSTAP